MRRLLLIVLLAAVVPAIRAQFNRKGTFQLALGLSAGAHRTEYVSTSTVLGIPVRTQTNDGAATVLVPIEVQYGVARPLSLGLFVEPGSYLDSSATRSNGLVLFGFQPRGYLVNHDRFAWFASLQIGSGSLRIDDTDGGVKEEATYIGPFFGLGSGVAFLFGDHFGLQGHLRYMGSSLQLKEYSRNGAGVDLSSLDAELTTTGIALQASLMFRF